MSQEMRPPINRAMRVLDKAFFHKRIPITAARVHNKQYISACRNELVKSGDICQLERMSLVVEDPEQHHAALGSKCILLQTGLKHDDASTWGETVTSMVKEGKITMIPHTINLEYDYWTYHDILASILPEDNLAEIPAGFQVVGHVAHLNLRESYLPYKDLIARVLLDKNPALRTVINKVDMVGEESEYRTFQYEVLAGPDDMDVTVREQDCIFRFNYAKVYWNSRLHTEHERLVGLFKEGEAICDVMAGIGPFAVPSGKKKCFVYANDLNPESHAALVDNVKLNKVGDFVTPFNHDGHGFIPFATKQLYNTARSITIASRQSRTSRGSAKPAARPPRHIEQPRFFSHYIMNLPASALSFLPNFVSLYSKAGISEDTPLPMVHVYCFSTKSDDNAAAFLNICEEISGHLGCQFRAGKDADVEGVVEIYDVRDVSPKKRMFCATFRLPASVAYR